MQPSAELLGHIISRGSVNHDLEKVKVMEDWPTPKNIKQSRGFLGLTGHYRKFIKCYAKIETPIIELLKKNAFL